MHGSSDFGMGRSRALVGTLGAACLVLACLQYVAGWYVPASAAPAVAVSQSIPAQTLVGRETPVELTFTNPGADRAFNLAFWVRLPLGVSVSSSDEAPSSVIVETDAAGDPVATVVAWENVVDIVPGGRFRFRYALSHDLGNGPELWSVGETIDAPVTAFVSDQDAVRPQIAPATAGLQVTAEASDFSQTGTAAGSTTLVPVLLRKSEPSIEGELLRGVHDHQTVYTISVETGSDPSGVGLGLVEDWIPAGLEFLGCGDEDNSLTEEYPGAGPLNPGNAPALADPCPTPVLVETVDSALPAGLAPGVYTHVAWDLGATLAPDSTATISYVAGIPQRANTTTWPQGEPGTASGDQGSNLDNNTGPLTTQVGDGTTWTNLAQVDTVFQGTPTTVEDTETVQAVDLSVHKFVDSTEIQQGALSTWQLYLETSEYVVDGGVSGLSLVDVTPDGTCPIGSTNPRCTVTQPDPVPDYTTSTYDGGTGETTLTWDLPSVTMGRSETFIVSFATEALTSYADGSPVSANDSWTNTVDLAADVTTFGGTGPDDPASHETHGVVDDSAQSQSGTAVSFRKDVGRPADGQPCGDGTDVSWDPDSVAATGPGDRVCFRLTADPPDSLDTIQASLTDFLPPGLRYEAGSSTAGPDNQVPPANVVPVTVAGTPAAGQRLDWTLLPSTSVEPAQTAQVVFGAILDGGSTPDLVVTGAESVNEARVTYQNTSGEIFVERDSAAADLTEAHLDLTKGISVVDLPSAPPTTFVPPVDTARDIVGDTAVTYALDVVNDGGSDAVDVEVRDLLAVNDQGIAAQDAGCAAITAVSDAGTCVGQDLVWTGLSIPAGQSLRLTYTWTLPATVPVATSWTNLAGVVDYHSTTNTGTDFTYVPRDNIDPAREPDANTDPADDDAHLSSPGIAMTKTRTTAIGEPGNALGNQATIGEVVSYTVETRQSANTDAVNYVLTDDLTGRGLTLVPGTVEVQTGRVTPGAACAYPDPAITPSPGGPLTVTGDLITLTAASINLANEDGCAVLRFDAVVQDVPDAGEPLNKRPGSVRNVARLTYDIDTGSGTVPGSVSAQVDTQVVEPLLALEKRASATTSVLPGTEVDYQLVVTNRTGAQVSTAHDLVVTDDFSGASVAAVVANPDGGTVAGSTITWTLPPDPDGDGTPGLSPGATFTLRYTVRLQDDLVAGAALTNTARAVTTSLAGSSPDQRTDASPCSPGGCPGYVDQDSASLTVGGPSIVKEVGTQVHTIGDEVVYGVEAFFPAHLDFGPVPVTVTDDLAGGSTTFLETVTAVCTGCSDADRAQFVAPEDNGTAGTASPRWDLGVYGASAVPRRVFLIYRVRVEDAPALGAGDSLTNTATLDYDNGSLDDDALVDIAEPDVTLLKRVATAADGGLRHTTPGTPATGVVGGTVSYELAVTNSGDWTAYDVVVTDEPDSVSSGGSCTGDARLEVVSVTSGPGWVDTDRTLGPGDGCLGFRIPTLLPGQTIRVVYQLVVPDDFPRSELIVGNELVNQAAVPDYFGLAAPDRVGNPDVRDYPDAPITDAGHVNLAGAALGDLVWLDVDADGLGPDTGDPGEPGIPGVTVTISGPGGASLTRTTDADGRWLTDDGTVPPQWLAAGTYTVTVDQTDLPPGLDNTADPDGGNDSTAQTTLAENEVDLTQDFGYAGDQTIGDLVWLDLDADGTADPGEPGIPDVDLEVVWAGFDGILGTADDVDYGTVTTDADGLYVARDLPAGPVRVTVDPTTLPAGVEASYDLDGGLDDTADRTLAVGEDARDVDFGYAGNASVGDLVWLDLDGDGVADPTEPGLPAVDLEVVWAGFDGALDTPDDVILPVTTAADGLYLADHLPAGDVRVSVATPTLPGGLTQTFDPDPTLDDQTVRTLSPGEDDRDADFGYRGVHEIGDLVWLDVDADGLGPDTGDPGEPGVPGQPLAVLWAGGDGVFGTADDVDLGGDVTGPDGRWSVTGVPDGPVRVSLDGAPATTLTVSADPDGTLDGVTERTITADDLDLDFGLTGTASVGDLVWLDLDGDGVVDPGEPPVPGVDVTVAWAGFDATLGTSDDVVYGTVTTDPDGLYRVGNLPPGDVRVSVDPATVPPGLVPTYDLDGGLDETADRTLAVGEDATDVDFGYRGEGEAGDLVWWDLDSDGVRDAGEPGLPQVRVTLDWAGFDGTPGTADDARLTTLTDADGGYLFTRLPAGDFVVTVDQSTLPSGLAQTFDPDGTLDSESAFSLAPGASDRSLDFAYAGDLALGDLVWRDIDRDRRRQADEPALGRVAVAVRFLGSDGVTGGGDDVTISTTTSARTARQGARRAFVGGVPQPGEPSYSVTGLVPGRYTVELDPATLPGDDAPFTDRDGGDPSSTRLRLAGESIDDADFGVFRNSPPRGVGPGSLSTDCGDRVVVDPLEGLEDANGDPLRVVPGSLRGPDGVDLELTSPHTLVVTPGVDDDFTVSWQVTDGRGGTTDVTFRVDVQAVCDPGHLPDSGTDVRPWWLPAGLGLLLLGIALILVDRRRRRG